MNKKATREFKVGFFLSLGILALLVFIIATGKVRVRGRGYELRVVFSYVGGLEEGAPVRVSGVRVGEVKRIEMRYETAPEIILVLKMKPDVRIGRHSRITIRTLGIIGEKYVEISPCQEKEFATAGETLRGIDPVDLDRLLTTGEDLVRNLNEVVTGVQRIVGSRDVQEKVKDILDNTDGLIASLRKITSDEEMITRFKRILANTEKATEKADSFLEQASQLTSSLEQTNEQLKKLLVSSQPRVEAVFSRMEELAIATTSTVKIFNEKLKRLDTLADSFQQTAEQAGKLLHELTNRGLVARLLKEETLIDEIKTEVQLLQETTAEVKKGAERFNELSADFKQTVCAITEVSRKATRLLDQIQSGQGTLARLLSDKETSDSVIKIIDNMQEITAGISQHGIFWRGKRTRQK